MQGRPWTLEVETERRYEAGFRSLERFCMETGRGRLEQLVERDGGWAARRE